MCGRPQDLPPPPNSLTHHPPDSVRRGAQPLRLCGGIAAWLPGGPRSAEESRGPSRPVAGLSAPVSASLLLNKGRGGDSQSGQLGRLRARKVGQIKQVQAHQLQAGLIFY